MDPGRGDSPAIDAADGHLPHDRDDQDRPQIIGSLEGRPPAARRGSAPSVFGPSPAPVVEPGSNLDRYTARQLFHFFVNSDRFPEKMDVALELVQRAHAQAQAYMACDRPELSPPWLWTYQPYDAKKTEERLLRDYKAVWQRDYQDWFDAGMPLDEASAVRYDVWWGATRYRMAQALVQRAPFNLTDGQWLRRAIPTGPLAAHHGVLLSTLLDEMGNGVVAQNHCNCYEAILLSMGIAMPDVCSEAFVQQATINDASFVKSAMVLATSMWPERFAAEILGYNLYIEWNSSPDQALMVQLLERWGLDATFAKLHVSIDNIEHGHGRNALSAIHKYLNQVDIDGGREAVQREWRRIWTGYVAYGITGNLNEQLKKDIYERDERESARERIVKILRRTGGRLSWSSPAFAFKGRPMTTWMRCCEPEALVKELEADATTTFALVVGGDPKRSRLMKELRLAANAALVTPDDLTEVALWILSLEAAAGSEMRAVLLAKRAAGATAHRSQLPDADGQRVAINDLFRGDPVVFMKVLRNAPRLTTVPEGRTADDAGLIRAACRERGPMAGVFSRHQLAVMREWVANGCPLPPA